MTPLLWIHISWTTTEPGRLFPPLPWMAAGLLESRVRHAAHSKEMQLSNQLTNALQYAYNMLSQIMSINRWDGVCPIASVSEGQRLSSGGTGLSHGFSQAAHGSSSS